MKQQQLQETILFLKNKGLENPEIGIVLGTGLGKLIDEISGFGKDLKITPKKTSVSLIRKHQFALIKPATKTRIDLGLKIKGQEPIGRLGDSGPFGTMCTHRIQLSSIEEIDREVIQWIKKAYDLSV